MSVTSYVCTRPESRSISLENLADGNYMVHSQFKDVFGRNISCDREIKVSGGSVRDDECRAMINGDFNKDGKVD